MSRQSSGMTVNGIRCGMVSSSRLHNPEVRELNRMEAKAKRLLLERKKKKAEEARQSQRDSQTKQKGLEVAIAGKQSRLSKFVGKVKEVLNKKVW